MYSTLRVIICIFSGCISAQITIKGKITDVEENPVKGVSVVVQTTNKKILHHTFSNEQGNYELHFQKVSDSVEITFRKLNYESISKKVVAENQLVDVMLEHQTEQLKEVVIQSPPIRKKGDTISYSVEHFSNESDRSIKDVLKKLPGIDVDESGRIYYQGQPINKFYIEGIDLMGGKYGIIHENLPYGEVDKVQVIERHQPIKILDSLVNSQNAAINLKLKNKIVVTGQGELGIGGDPFLWEANTTPILIRKNKQFLGSYQSNNSGRNIAQQARSLSIENLIDQFLRLKPTEQWLGIVKVNSPPIEEKRWLFNQTHLGSANFIFKDKKSTEWRLNVDYLNDYSKRQGVNTTVFLTQNTPVTLIERNTNRFSEETIEGQLSVERNTKKVYLKNLLKMGGEFSRQFGTIENINPIQQRLSTDFFRAENFLKMIFPIGKQLVNFYSNLHYHQSPQLLRVTPGQFIGLLNQNTPYETLEQSIQLKEFSSDSYFSFVKKLGRWTVQPHLGMYLTDSQLNSDIEIDQQAASNGFQNDLVWRKRLWQLNIPLFYKANAWELNVYHILNWNNFQVNENFSSLKNAISQFTYEPRFQLIYHINSYWKTRLNGRRTYNFGTLQQFFPNFILRNYRNLEKIQTDFPVNITHAMDVSLEYRDALKGWFLNGSVTFSETLRNLLQENTINNDGTRQILFQNQENLLTRRVADVSATKYLSSIKTKIKLGLFASENNQEISLNQVIQPFTIQMLGCNLSLDVNHFEKLSLSAKSSFDWTTNRVGDRETSKNFNQNHSFSIHYFLNDKHWISLQSDWTINRFDNQSYSMFFQDVVWRYTPSKKKWDIELVLQNIFNSTEFNFQLIQSQIITTQSFQLRPRQLLVSVRFRF